MTEQTPHPEEQTDPQDQSLEEQLDALLRELEAVEPDTVPPDLRQNKPQAEPTATAPPPAPELEELVAQQASDDAANQPTAEPDKSAGEPVPSAVADTESAPVEAEEKPTQNSGMDLDAVAAMATDLLNQQMAAPDASADSAEEPSDSNPDTKASADTDGYEASKAESQSDDDALGEQINSLLQEMQAANAKAEPAEAEDPTAEPAVTAEQADVVESEPSPVSTDEKATDTDGQPVSIEQIDEMLAEAAEQAIEQDNEASTPEVPGTDEILAVQNEAEVQPDNTEDQTVVNEESAGDESPEPQPVSATTEQAEPEPVSTGASAEDVARELAEDESPEPVEAATEAEPVPTAIHEGIEPEPDLEVTTHVSAIKQAELALLRICAKINRPVNRLSPEMKNTVGYIGVVMLLPGLGLLLYSMLF